MKNWIEIATTSEHSAVVEIKKSFDEGNLIDVEEGLTQLLETMANSERKALLSQLVRLMSHVIKWKIQTEKRTRSWKSSINNARFEIQTLQEFSPSLNKNYVLGIWEKALSQAKIQANDETGISTEKIETLTWQEVFEQEYNL
jgi:16S rRNA A1518/A1519 N6-dimethyltransferase RsmA/KsgA/DIM1 with predicted DNA glycosylase/AP lyase activity